MVSRIGEMLAYQSFNVKSPLNGEAARWVEKTYGQGPAGCDLHDSRQSARHVGFGITNGCRSDRSKSNPGHPGNAGNTACIAFTASDLTQQRLSPHTVTPAFQPTESPKPSVQSPPAQAPQTNSTEFAIVTCPGCKAKFRIRSENRGKQFRCPKCKTAFQ